MKIDVKAGSVKGKRILITGASSGLGKAFAEAFLAEGAKVGVCARRRRLLEPLRKAGAAAVEADVSDAKAVERLLAEVRRELGGLDALVNNAAVLPEGRLAEQPLEEWRRTIDINLTGALLCARAAAGLIERGVVLNITSGLGFFPMEPYNAYCVSKAGLNMLTRALALEWEGRIAVNAVDPGVAKTEMNPTAPHAPSVVVPVVRALIALGQGGPTGKCFKKSGEEVPWDLS